MQANRNCASALYAHPICNCIGLIQDPIKEEIILSELGYIQVHAYNSYAQLPLKDTAITITDKDGAAIAMRLTNRSGILDDLIPIPVPDLSASQSPNTGVIPFSAVNLYARLEDYEEIFIENLQVFPGTVTFQDLEMIPLSEFPDSFNKLEVFDTPPQNL